MNNIIKGFILFSVAVALFFATSCCTGNPEPAPPPSGSLNFEFKHKINGESIIFDTLMYTNDAGNVYMVNEIQYFISDVTIYTMDGKSYLLNSWNDIHYIDTDISDTKTYTFKDEIPVGTYNKISFTFGINEQKNNSLMFVNPPESFMFWPEQLGGGYHYMKLNGKWINELNQISPFNFHLGIGQIYQSFPDSISEFIQNYFTVDMIDGDFVIKENNTTTLDLVMNVENWFRNPNTYNHNFWGGDIMQKQDAMHQAVENGHDVFSYSAE